MNLVAIACPCCGAADLLEARVNGGDCWVAICFSKCFKIFRGDGSVIGPNYSRVVLQEIGYATNIEPATGRFTFNALGGGRIV